MHLAMNEPAMLMRTPTRSTPACCEHGIDQRVETPQCRGGCVWGQSDVCVGAGGGLVCGENAKWGSSMHVETMSHGGVMSLEKTTGDCLCVETVQHG